MLGRDDLFGAVHRQCRGIGKALSALRGNIFQDTILGRGEAASKAREEGQMRKPIHPCAVLLSVIAVAYLLAYVRFIMSVAGPGDYWVSLAQAAFTNSAELLGIGVLIELVDQIRWNALPPEKQVPRHYIRRAGKAVRGAIRYLRGWPRHT